MERLLFLKKCHKKKVNIDDFVTIEALEYYYEQNFHFISLGDEEELWENTVWPVKAKNKASIALQKKFLLQQRYTKGDKESAIVEAIGQKEYSSLLASLRENKIFIWSKGDLETYYTPSTKALSGSKDIKALEVSYLLQNEGQAIDELFLHIEEVTLLIDLIVEKP